MNLFFLKARSTCGVVVVSFVCDGGVWLLPLMVWWWNFHIVRVMCCARELLLHRGFSLSLFFIPMIPRQEAPGRLPISLPLD